MKFPLPVSSRWSSRRLTGLPAPNRRLPGRMFISLSFAFLWMALQVSGHVSERGFHRLALIGRQRSLRRHGIADVITLNRKPRLDAGCEIKAREGFVDAPEFSLQHHRPVPALRFAEIVEFDALPRDDAGRARHPADTTDQHHRGRNMRRCRKHLDAVAAAIDDREQPPGIARSVL